MGCFLLTFDLLSCFFELIAATGNESWGHVILVILPSQTGNRSFTMCIFYHLIYNLCLLYHSVLLSSEEKICRAYLCLSCFLFFTGSVRLILEKKIRLQWIKCKSNIQIVIFLFQLWNRQLSLIRRCLVYCFLVSFNFFSPLAGWCKYLFSGILEATGENL